MTTRGLKRSEVIDNLTAMGRCGKRFQDISDEINRMIADRRNRVLIVNLESHTIKGTEIDFVILDEYVDYIDIEAPIQIIMPSEISKPQLTYGPVVKRGKNKVKKW